MLNDVEFSDGAFIGSEELEFHLLRRWCSN